MNVVVTSFIIVITIIIIIIIIIIIVIIILVWMISRSYFSRCPVYAYSDVHNSMVSWHLRTKTVPVW